MREYDKTHIGYQYAIKATKRDNFLNTFIGKIFTDE